MSGDNPYSGFSGYGAPQVNAGSDIPATAAPVLIQDTTTQGFPQDVIAESRKQPVLGAMVRAVQATDPGH